MESRPGRYARWHSEGSESLSPNICGTLQTGAKLIQTWQFSGIRPRSRAAGFGGQAVEYWCDGKQRKPRPAHPIEVELAKEYAL